MSHAPTLPTGWEVASRVLWFGGLAGLLGTLLTHVAVIRPALGRLDPSGPARAAALAVSRRTVAFAAVAAAAAYLARLVATVAQQTSTGPLTAASPGRIWSFVTAPAPARTWLSRGALISVQGALVAATVVLVLTAVQLQVERLLTLALVPALAVQLVKAVPVAAAAAQQDRLIGTLLTQAHIVAGCVWLGGLTALAVLTRAHRRLPGLTADVWAAQWRRFSALASVGVGVVVVSGVWLTWVHVGSLDQLLDTTYGRVLTIKIVFVAALMAIGGYNQLALLPRIERLRRAGHDAPVLRLAVGHFGRVVLTEVGLGVGVLVAVAYLTGSARAEAGGTTPASGPSVWLWVLLLTLVVIGMFAVTARLAGFLAARPLAADPAAEPAVSPR